MKNIKLLTLLVILCSCSGGLDKRSQEKVIEEAISNKKFPIRYPTFFGFKEGKIGKQFDIELSDIKKQELTIEEKEKLDRNQLAAASFGSKVKLSVDKYTAKIVLKNKSTFFSDGNNIFINSKIEMFDKATRDFINNWVAYESGSGLLKYDPFTKKHCKRIGPGFYLTTCKDKMMKGNYFNLECSKKGDKICKDMEFKGKKISNKSVNTLYEKFKDYLKKFKNHFDINDLVIERSISFAVVGESLGDKKTTRITDLEIKEKQ